MSDKIMVERLQAQKSYPFSMVKSLVVIGLLGLGLLSGFLLVKRNQDLRRSANVGGSDCGQSINCVKLDTAGNTGSYTANRTIDYFIVKAGTEAFRFPGDTSGCYSASINDKVVTWQKTGPGPDCRDVSHVEIWLVSSTVSPTIAPTATTAPTLPPTLTPTTPPGVTIPPTIPPSSTPIPTATLSPTPTRTPTPTPTRTPTPSPTTVPTLPPGVTASPTPTPEFIAKCNGLYVYDQNWNLLTVTEWSTKKVGEVLRLATSATVNWGFVDRARFVINDVTYPQTTLKRPGTELFYYDFIIPSGTNRFAIKAELHHSTQGWF